MWKGFDPKAEPLETEVLKAWEEDGVVLRVVRFRIGEFKGKQAKLAGIYGVPKSAIEKQQKLPGLLQIHGGGQYADHRACVTNAKRGYATLSIAWAGRISSTQYRVNPDGVKLFWANKTGDANYRLTTDWGALDGYHAPSRYRQHNFHAIEPADFTIDSIDSPRNNAWFLCALAARRALTFLEREPNVDPERLGVYGHSMGGKLTVMTSSDPRVKACAPSCGGISDLFEQKPLFQTTINDHVNLKEISCPIFFLSPSNDFHGRIGDLPAAIRMIGKADWRVTCSPHMNHKDSAEYAVATQLWFDQHLKGTFKTPVTPRIELTLGNSSGSPSISIMPDPNKKPVSVDVFYTQNGKDPELPRDRIQTMTRYWHHAKAKKNGANWTALLPLEGIDKPLWVYANVLYRLDSPIVGSGYYYGEYKAESFVLSSLIRKVGANELVKSGNRVSLQPQLMIEDFGEDWEQGWIIERGNRWALRTNKLGSKLWAAPENASLEVTVRSDRKAKFILMAGEEFGAELQVDGTDQWKTIRLELSDFTNFYDKPLDSWNGVGSLKFCPAQHLRPKPGSKDKPKVIGGNWQGEPPEFKYLRWITSK